MPQCASPSSFKVTHATQVPPAPGCSMGRQRPPAAHRACIGPCATLRILRERDIDQTFIGYLFDNHYVTTPGTYWLSGSELADQSNIITYLLPNWKPVKTGLRLAVGGLVPSNLGTTWLPFGRGRFRHPPFGDLAGTKHHLLRTTGGLPASLQRLLTRRSSVYAFRFDRAATSCASIDQTYLGGFTYPESPVTMRRRFTHVVASLSQNLFEQPSIAGVSWRPEL